MGKNGATTLKLYGFRRFDEYECKLTSPTVIIGPNGVGKTTILEALYYVSMSRSYRTSNDREMIGWQTDTARVLAQFSNGLELNRAVSTFGGTVAKQSSTNGVPTTPLQSLGQIHVVLFAPELIELIVGPPRTRRRYLDMLLSATDRAYAQSLLKYHHGLRQRNALLFQEPTNGSAFDIWEQLLIENGTLIITKRKALMKLLAKHIGPAFEELESGRTKRQIKLAYQSTPDIEERYMELLIASRERDRRGAGTSVGPHRDDFTIHLEDRSMSFASRGEQRSLLIALKHAELALYASLEHELPPYLLLDDLFSELDQRRSKQLTTLLTAYPTIVTTTDATLLDDRLRKSAEILDLSSVPALARV